MDGGRRANAVDDGPVTRASTFGALLRRHRLAAGLSQEVLAERARMSINGISALERGDRRSPQRETLALLADALDLSAEQRKAFVAAAARPKLPRPSAGGATVTPGPWTELVSRQLPAPLSSFVGRGHELSEIAELLREHRLVTLTGAGGVGKTRTALEVWRILGERSEADIRLVELASLSDPSQVVGAIAASLGVQATPDQPVMEMLVAYLRRKTQALLLDNCEHLIAEVAKVSETLLQSCPDLRVLATSRERLHVSGERAYRLPPLETPSPEAALHMRAETAGEIAAIALFVDRARAVNHRFSLNDDDVPVIAEICRRLDGIPLAIELAAARVNVLPPSVLASRLDRRFAVLTEGGRTVLPRQQTMQATIDWSVALLSEPERKLLRRLGIFSGGWSLEAAQAVCWDDDVEPSDIFSALTSLVEKSLVMVRFSSEFKVVDRDGNVRAPRQARFVFLESIREYALEALAKSGEHDRVARSHAEWAGDYGEWIQEWRFYDNSGFYRVATIPDAFEMPNRHAALRWAVRSEDALLAGRIAGTFPWFDVSLDIIGLFETALARIDGAQHPNLEARILLATAGGVFVVQNALGDRALDAVRRAISLLKKCDERDHWLAEAYGMEVRRCLHTARYAEALEASDRQFEIMEELAATDPSTRGCWFADRGVVLQNLRRYEEARETLTEALALSQVRTELLPWTSALADVEAQAGNVRRAVTLADEAAATVSRDEWPALEGAERGALTENRTKVVAYRLMLGDIDAARQAAVDAFDLASRRWGGIAILTHLSLATLAALTGDAERAARMRGYIDVRYGTSGVVRQPTDERTYEFLVTALEQRSGEAETRRLAANGATLTEDQAADLAAAIANKLRSPLNGEANLRL